MQTTVLSGQPLAPRAPRPTGQPLFRLPDRFNRDVFAMDDEQLGHHVLTLGGTGAGKTNVIGGMVDGLRRTAGPNDVFIFFDTKGDYLARAYREGDRVLGRHPKANVHWNPFAEVMAEGRDPELLYDNALELATTLCYDKIRDSAQPFFPESARDVLASLMYAFCRRGLEDHPFAQAMLSADAFRRFFDRDASPERIIEELDEYDETRSACYTLYGGGEITPQTQGVMAELMGVVREIFSGVFARRGSFSIRQFVKRGGGKALFIAFDMTHSATQLPIYRALIDLALKEALGGAVNGRRVFLVLDELKLLPNLQYLENAINYGRSQGVRVIAGVQSVHQLRAAYGADEADAIMGGFGSMLAFRSPDAATRQYISDRLGKLFVSETYIAGDGTQVEHERIAQVAEDWRLLALHRGDALIDVPDQTPSGFAFGKY